MPEPAPAGAPRRLVLLRHGRTAWNLDGRAQGHADVELDEVGHAQAAAVAPLLASYRPVALWSSDLARAAGTAAYVGSATGLAPRLDPAFREYAVGRARTGLTLAEYELRHPDEVAALAEGRVGDVPGRETDADVISRFLPALEVVLAGLAPGECAIVVSHGAALKTALVTFLGLGLEARDALRALGNCHWVELEESDSEFLGGGPRWRLRAFNLSAPEEAQTPDFASGDAVG